MLYCTVLHCIILYSVVLDCIVLYCIVSYHIILLYRSVVYCLVYYTQLFFFIFFFINRFPEVPYVTVLTSCSPGTEESGKIPMLIFTLDDFDSKYEKCEKNEVKQEEKEKEEEGEEKKRDGENVRIYTMDKNRNTDCGGMLRNESEERINNTQNMRNQNSEINSCDRFHRSGISAPKVFYLAVKGSSFPICQTKIKDEEDDDDDESFSDSEYNEDSSTKSGQKSSTNDIDMNYENKYAKKWEEKELQQTYVEKEINMRDEENSIYTTNLIAFLKREKKLVEQIEKEEYFEKEKSKTQKTIPWGLESSVQVLESPVQDLLRLGLDGDAAERGERIRGDMRNEEGLLFSPIYFYLKTFMELIFSQLVFFILSLFFFVCLSCTLLIFPYSILFYITLFYSLFDINSPFLSLSPYSLNTYSYLLPSSLLLSIPHPPPPPSITSIFPLTPTNFFRSTGCIVDDGICRDVRVLRLNGSGLNPLHCVFSVEYCEEDRGALVMSSGVK